MTDNGPTRRELLSGAAGLAVLGCAGCVRQINPDLVAPAAEGAVAVSLAEYPRLHERGGVVALAVRERDERILLLRTPDDELVALSMVCTHWGCDVKYNSGAQRLDCPCHGSRFDLEGKVLEGPADEPLVRYAVETEGDQVLVRLSGG